MQYCVGKLTFVLPSSICSTSLLVGSKKTAGKSIAPGSTCHKVIHSTTYAHNQEISSNHKLVSLKAGVLTFLAHLNTLPDLVLAQVTRSGHGIYVVQMAMYMHMGHCPGFLSCLMVKTIVMLADSIQSV